MGSGKPGERKSQVVLGASEGDRFDRDPRIWASDFAGDLQDLQASAETKTQSLGISP